MSGGHRLSLAQGRDPAAGAALVLSGLSYGCERPLLADTAAVLEATGASVLRVDFGFADDPGFMAADDAAQFAAIEAEGRALLARAVALAGSGPLWIAGKSLGTLAMGGMLHSAAPPAARWIWLTPSLNGTPLLARMAGCPGPSLSLIGSRDPSVAVTRASAYRALPSLTHVEVAGADHGWTHPDGPDAEGEIARQARRAVADWVAAHA